ncbi:MAG: DUF6508 domain-containing protein [Actinomycetota bacterium]
MRTSGRRTRSWRGLARSARPKEQALEIDKPIDEIDWSSLFAACAQAKSWSELLRVVFVSGVLLSEYTATQTEADVDDDEVLEHGSVEQLRAVLTRHVREDRFAEGAGEEYFWSGTFDEILAVMASRMNVVYDPPRRVLPCPTCGDASKIQTVVFGMPARMPTSEDEAQYHFAGCVVDDEMGDWYCPTCEEFYRIPWTDPFEWNDPKPPSSLRETLTVDELGQVYRDITLGRPARVGLDTDAKKQAFLDAHQDVRDIAARGYIIETPE